MRASATSQTVTPANIPASQAKPEANKADAASPFALLMEATAKDSAKTARKDATESADKPADDKSIAKQDAVKQNTAKQDDNAAAAQANAKPATPAKAAKPEKNPDTDEDAAEDETGKAETDEKLLASAQQQASDQPVPPPVAPAPIAAIPDTDADAAQDIPVDVARPLAAAAPSPGMPTGNDLPQAAPMDDTPAEPGTIAQAQAPQEHAHLAKREADGPETAAASVAAPPVPAPPATKDTAKPVKTAAKSESAGTVAPDSADVERIADDPTQAVKAGDKIIRSDQDIPAKTNIAVADGTNGGIKAAHHAIADTDKPAAPDSQKADAPRADVRPVEDNTASAAAKPAPQPAAVSNAALAINTIAAPQAAPHSQAPVVTQHVQVTAQAAPDVPALAVEIAAKSQSGAKQFDIRLDPPELGRVEVRLSIDATGKASAHLSADQPQTLSLLQKDASILTRALREAGLDVAQDGLNFSLRQQAGGQNGNSGNDGNNGRFGGSRAFSLAATASIDPAASFAYRAPADGRVDIRV